MTVNESEEYINDDIEEIKVPFNLNFEGWIQN